MRNRYVCVKEKQEKQTSSKNDDCKIKDPIIIQKHYITLNQK